MAALALGACFAPLPASAQTATHGASPLPAVDLAKYQGTWHQIASYPNRFQDQCAAQTSAQYTPNPDGTVTVVNRCRTASGDFEEVRGIARPRDGARLSGTLLEPASLEVSFLPAWLRWLPVGWGQYDVVQLQQGGTVSIVSEPTREYLWVLSRSAPLSAQAWAEVRQWLSAAGYDVGRLVLDPQGVTPAGSSAVSAPAR